MKKPRLPLVLVVALSTTSLLAACGSEVVDLRNDDITDSGSTSAGGDACATTCNEAVTPMVSTGLMHACALTTTGAVKCWGSNTYGQLGDSSTADSHAPVDVVSLSSGVLAVSLGAANTCARTEAGAVQCWGPRLHDGAEDPEGYSTVPVEVMSL
jgi:hypothetical protein